MLTNARKTSGVTLARLGEQVSRRHATKRVSAPLGAWVEGRAGEMKRLLTGLLLSALVAGSACESASEKKVVAGPVEDRLPRATEVTRERIETETEPTTSWPRATDVPPASPPTTRATIPPTTAARTRVTKAPGATQTKQSCHSSYEGTCIPPDVSDADCAGGSGNGPWYVKEKDIRVVGPDVFDLDRDGDGIGCES